MIVILFLLPAVIFPLPQDLQFEHITIKDGLSNNSVICILQDSYGFLWFGTSDGLNRWDGLTFKIFTHDANDSGSISNNFILSLHEDSFGRIWIGTSHGLNLYDPHTEKFTRYLHDEGDSNSISNNIVNTIFEDSAGNIWLGTPKGLNRYNQENDDFTRYFFPGQWDSVSFWWNNNTIRAINETEDGKLLLGTTNQFLIFDPKTKETKIIPYAIPERRRWPTVNLIYRDRSGKFWIAMAGDGFIEYNPETGETQLHKHETNNPYSFADRRSNSVCEDKSGRLWIGTPDQGLAVFDRATQRFRHYKPEGKQENGFSGRNVQSIYEDKHGNLWVGTGDSGLNLIPKWQKSFRHYVHDPQNSNSLAHGEVTTFYEGKDGLLWIAHYLSGISLLNRNSGDFTHITHDPRNPASLSRGSVFGICEDRFGYLWLATSPYLDRLDRKTGIFRHYQYDPSNPKSHAYAISLCCYEDHQGTLWLGITNAGLERFNRIDETFDRFCHDATDTNSISSNRVQFLYQDKAGNFWIGTDQGLNQLVCDSRGKEKFTRYQPNPSHPQSIAGKDITAIYEDRNGRLWIGTEAGLNLFDRERKSFKAITEKDGLPSNTIMGILEDDQGLSEGKAGNLWLRTPQGIVKFNPETGKLRIYDERDGLTYCKSILEGYAAFYKGESGEIYSGGANSVAVFHPDSLKDNPDPPKIMLTDFKINYESVKVGADSPLKKSVSFTNVIKLAYYQNIISFEFSALDYTAPAKNQYAYKLEGVNPDWVYTDASRRIATYTNLDPGQYVFRVKGSNNDGVWNEEGASVRIIIDPPFWQTSWFRLLILLAAAGLIYLVYRYRINRLLELERMRIQIASDLHDDIGSALTKIAVHSEIIQTTGEKTKVKESSRKIGEMSREIITTLSDIVWSIDARNDSVGDLIDRMRDFLDTAFSPGSIRIDFQTKGLTFQQKINQTLRQNIYLIFKEAVHNAAKHSQASQIRIYLTNGEGDFCMEIADNGKGMDVNQERLGHHGLANMRLRAARIGGELRIEALNGTCVILTAKAI